MSEVQQISSEIVDDKDKLCENNMKIIQDIIALHRSRNEICDLISKQENERSCFLKQLEHWNYKVQLIDKSINQRKETLQVYDRKIKETEEKYKELLKLSEFLITFIKDNINELDNIMNKKVGTFSDSGMSHISAKCASTCCGAKRAEERLI